MGFDAGILTGRRIHLAAIDVDTFKAIGLVFFFGFFLVLVLRLVFGSKASFAARARMPLSDTEIVEPRETQPHD